MTPTEVKATERIELQTGDKPSRPRTFGISDNDTIAGLDAEVVYEFAYNKLVSGHYNVTTKHTNPTDSILDYDRLAKVLTERYGAPFDNREVWKNSLYKNDSSNWGLAISAGHMFKTAHWATDKSGIDLLLSGDNFKISLVIWYYSLNKEHMALKKRADMAEDNNKL